MYAIRSYYEHEVLLIDGNTQPMSDEDLVRFALDNGIGLVRTMVFTHLPANAFLVLVITSYSIHYTKLYEM